ncbi:MAG: NAD kinase [Bacteroidetes bacterium]|nr:NAD kinase [Bacteroidota bacterium]
MKIAVYGRLLNDPDSQYIQKLFDLLDEKDHDIFIYHEYYNRIKEKIKFNKELPVFNDHKDIPEDLEYVFSLGGDGTLLDTVTLVRNSKIPVVGINIGRLGFLASIGKEEIETAINSLEQNSYVLDSRSLIHLESNPALFGEVSYGLNEFTIHKKDSSAMITIHTYLNGEYLSTYWADGLIVATPTGSTGYSLSCGGPVIFPTSENFVITPVAPHNLNVRPMIVPNDNVISFEIEGRSESFLCSLDSRHETIDASAQLAVRLEDFKFNLVRLNENNFLTTLRKKIMWGMDTRNYPE